MTDENSSSDPCPYLQIHRTAPMMAARIAQTFGMDVAKAGWGLFMFWSRCAEPRELQALFDAGKRSLVLSPSSLKLRLKMAFGLELEADALIEVGVLAKDPDGFRVRGCSRYFDVLEARKRQSEKGAKGAKSRWDGKHRHGTGMAAAKQSTEKRDQRSEKKEEEKKKTPRALSDKEECWDLMEAARVDHCQRLGLPPGKCQRPKLCNKQVTEALTSAGITDDVITGSTRVSGLEYLQILFEEYLRGDFGRTDKDGAQRDAPWPIGVFLSPNVLSNCKRKYEAEEQAA